MTIPLRRSVKLHIFIEEGGKTCRFVLDLLVNRPEKLFEWDNIHDNFLALELV